MKTIVLGLIRLYQHTFSKAMPQNTCRFYPTCSHYGYEAIEKYGKDRAKQQEETMKIYQQYGVNPAAGCFPALVQIPVFIGLYTALRFVLDHGSNPAALAPILINPAWAQHAANFNTGFLWIANLAKPDPFYIW